VLNLGPALANQLDLVGGQVEHGGQTARIDGHGRRLSRCCTSARICRWWICRSQATTGRFLTKQNDWRFATTDSSATSGRQGNFPAATVDNIWRVGWRFAATVAGRIWFLGGKNTMNSNKIRFSSIWWSKNSLFRWKLCGFWMEF